MDGWPGGLSAGGGTDKTDVTINETQKRKLQPGNTSTHLPEIWMIIQVMKHLIIAILMA